MLDWMHLAFPGRQFAEVLAPSTSGRETECDDPLARSADADHFYAKYHDPDYDQDFMDVRFASDHHYVVDVPDTKNLTWNEVADDCTRVTDVDLKQELHAEAMINVTEMQFPTTLFLRRGRWNVPTAFSTPPNL